MPLLASLLVMARPSVSAVRVTIDCPAKSAALALADLSQKAGVPLWTSLQTEHEVIAFHMVDVPLGTALNRIATTMNAEWHAEGAGYRLTRSSSQKMAEKRAEFNARQARVLQALVPIRHQATALQPFSPSVAQGLAARLQVAVRRFSSQEEGRFWSETAALDAAGPLHRALIRLAAKLDSAALAEVRPGRQIVFSTNPYASQLSFGSSVQGIGEAFLNEQRVWSDAYERWPIERPRTVDGKGAYSLGNLGENSQPFDGPLGRMLLSVQASEHQIALRLTVLDRVGKPAGKAEQTLALDEDEVLKVPTPGSSPRLPVTEAMRTFVNLAAKDPLPPLLRERVLNPERTDFLTIVASPLLIACAKAKGTNLVAVLPDEAALTLPLGTNGSVSVDGYLGALRREGNVVDLHDGWLDVHPVARASSRERQLDRRRLGEYLRALKRGPLDFASRARYADALYSSGNNLAYLLACRVGFAPEHLGDVRLAFYGSLTEEQRFAARNSGLPFGRLTEHQIDGLCGLLPESTDGLTFLKPAEPPPSRELTDAVPRGLLVDGVLNLRDASESPAVQLTLRLTSSCELTLEIPKSAPEIEGPR